MPGKLRDSKRVAGSLRVLESRKLEYGPGCAERKLAALDALLPLRLSRSDQVLRLHELLVFLRAYPDDSRVLGRVERALAAFERRRDLARHRDDLADTGIAGTELRYPFFWFTALWLARRWPERLRVEWPDFEGGSRLESILGLLVPYCESTVLDELTGPPAEWIRYLKGSGETDAAFLIRRFERMAGSSFTRESLFESFDLPLLLSPGPGTPSRTHARYARSPVVYRKESLSRARPDLRSETLRPPLSVRTVSRREGRRLVDLAREAMVTRSRDLNVFEHADERDVRLADVGGGLQFACLGVVPERRLLLESAYGFLTLQNGVPIGYVLLSALFASSEVAFNVFETFRGGEAGRVFGRVLGLAHALFGSDSFTIGADQLGQDNEEGLQSGAWWFYYKSGFRPHARHVQRLAARELARIRRKPSYRSSVPTLIRLSSESLFWYLGSERPDVLGRISLGNIGLAISRRLARQFGADREAGIEESAREAARLLGRRSRMVAAERMAWERWGPLVLCLPGVERWSPAVKRGLADIVVAKWSGRESDFVRLFNRHHPLRLALVRLAGGER